MVGEVLRDDNVDTLLSAWDPKVETFKIISTMSAFCSLESGDIAAPLPKVAFEFLCLFSAGSKRIFLWRRPICVKNPCSLLHRTGTRSAASTMVNCQVFLRGLLNDIFVFVMILKTASWSDCSGSVTKRDEKVVGIVD